MNETKETSTACPALPKRIDFGNLSVFRRGAAILRALLQYFGDDIIFIIRMVVLCLTIFSVTSLLIGVFYLNSLLFALGFSLGTATIVRFSGKYSFSRKINTEHFTSEVDPIAISSYNLLRNLLKTDVIDIDEAQPWWEYLSNPYQRQRDSVRDELRTLALSISAVDHDTPLSGVDIIDQIKEKTASRQSAVDEIEDLSNIKET